MNNTKYVSKTLICLAAIGTGLSYIRSFKNKESINSDNKNNIDNIFEKKNNDKLIYTEEERKNIFNEFKKKNNLNIIHEKKDEENKIIINNDSNIYNLINSELKISEKKDIYLFNTNKKCNYKIIIEFDVNKLSADNKLFDIEIILNNFKYFIKNNIFNNILNNKINIIFDNIIFNENDYQKLELKNINNIINDNINIFIKESTINIYNNGIFIINKYPYYFENNYLPNSLKEYIIYD
jgi:hypothetical protein